MKQLRIFTDGGSRGNPGPSACAFVVYGVQNNILFESQKLLGIHTNNYAEYQGLQLALIWLSENFQDVSEVKFFLDSLLVVNQTNGKFKVKDQNILNEYLQVKKLLQNLLPLRCSFTHIPRELNKRADYLVNLALDSAVN
jgi:ribonuclease HI